MLARFTGIQRFSGSSDFSFGTLRSVTLHGRYLFIFQPLARTAGIVMCTLHVNSTKMKKLLEKLGMSDISDARKIAMANAVRQIQESNQRRPSS